MLMVDPESMLQPCSPEERAEILLAGTDLLDHIHDDIEQCDKQEEQDGFKYYASFPCASGNGTEIQAVFHIDDDAIQDGEYELECFVRGQDAGADWNMKQLC